MKCRELKFEIQQYADGSLASEHCGDVEAHLDTCPLCRTDVAALRSLRNELGSLRRREMAVRSLHRVRSAVAAEFMTSYGLPEFRLIEVKENWVSKWMWPTTIGTVTSVAFGLFLVAVIMIPADVPRLAISTDEPVVADDSLFLARRGQGDLLITPQQFASSRADISQESPSLNPAGTLVDAAQSDERDDEAVFVADIYENGSAQITDVVESSRDRKMMNRLMAAFRPDRSAPPFVPASLDNRENLVRVVLKFQNVNVNIDDGPSLR